MFELIEDHPKPEIYRWTLPCIVLIIFLVGVDAGLLIGKHSADLESWLTLAFLVFLAWRLSSPVFQEIKSRIRTRE